MAIRRGSAQAATLTGGDLSVDVLHTEDSVRLGDGTNLLGAFADVGGVRSLPVDVKQTVGVVPANLTSGTARSKITDGADNVEIQTVGAEKALKVSVIATVGGGSGGTAATDSAAFTATSTQFTPIGGHLDDVGSDALAEGEMGAVRMTSARALHVAVQNSVGVTGTFWQATQPVSGTFWQATQPVSGTFWQATQPVSGTVSINSIPAGANAIGTVGVTSLPAIPAGTNNIGDVDVLTLPAIPAGANAIGTVGVTSVTAAAANNKVDIGLINAVAPLMGAGNTGTGSLRVTIATDQANFTTPMNVNNAQVAGVATATGNGVVGTGVQRVAIASDNTAFSVIPVGNVAHDAVDSTAPIKIGGKAQSSFPTAVAHLDRVDAMFDLRGRFITHPNGPRENGALTSTTITASVVETTIAAAAGAGIFKELLSLVITNSSATGTLVTLRDSTAGTIRGIFYVPATGGIVITPSAPMHQGTANSNWTITCGTSVSSIYVMAQTMNVV